MTKEIGRKKTKYINEINEYLPNLTRNELLEIRNNLETKHYEKMNDLYDKIDQEEYDTFSDDDEFEETESLQNIEQLKKSLKESCDKLNERARIDANKEKKGFTIVEVKVGTKEEEDIKKFIKMLSGMK